MRKPNGYGSVIKLSGNRRKPYAVRVTVGWELKERTATQKYRYLGYYRTSKEAEIALADYNKNPFEVGESLTLGQLYSLWSKASFPRLSERTADSYAKAWENLSPLSDKVVTNLTRKNYQDFLDKQNFHYNTARRIKIVLNLMYKYATQNDRIPAHMAAIPSYLIIDTFDKSKSLKRAIFEPTDISRMWTDKKYSVYLILIYSGLRIGEFLNLTKEDVNLEKKYLDIKQAKTQSGIRQVPIADKILPLVTDLYENSTDKLAHFGYDKYARELRKDFNHSLHDTRHTCITMLTEKNVDPRIIKQIVGHSGSGVTEAVYTHVTLEKKLEAINLI